MTELQLNVQEHIKICCDFSEILIKKKTLLQGN